jgi:flagellar protein FliO/FliZ
MTLATRPQPGPPLAMFPARLTAFAAACAGMLLAAPPVLAASSGESTPLNLPPAEQTGAAAGGGGGGLVRTFVGLAIVLAVIYGLYWVLKQVKASRETAASGQGLESVATIPLGPNRALHLVRAGREFVLLGVAEQAVVPIRAYREDEARALGLLDRDAPFEADPPTAPPSAAAALRDLVARLQQKTVRS